MLICISGFLTEDVEKTESWKAVLSHYKHAEVFSLQWNSLTVENFFKEGHFKNKKGGGGLMQKLMFIKTGRKQFKYALEQTRVAGTMLALFLLRSEALTGDRVISLIGHSLGTVIILHTLTILHYFYEQGIARAGRIIHDVMLLGGAAVLNPTGKVQEELNMSNTCAMANGKLCNCYSKKDFVLKYMFMSVLSDYKPIGLIPIFEDIPEDTEDATIEDDEVEN